MNRYLSIIVQCVLLVAFLATAGMLPAGAQTQDADPQGYVERLIGDLISSDGQKVDIHGLSVGLTGNVQAERATVSDIDGVWLDITGFSLDWRPLSLLGGTIEVNRLAIAEIAVSRWPGRPPTESDAGVPAPRPVNIGEIEIERIVLADGLAGDAAEFTARAHASITNDPVRISVDAQIERIDDIPGRYAAMIEYRPESEALDIDIRATDGPSGLIGHLLNIPGRPELALELTGSGTLDNWSGEISLRSGSAEALAGEVRIAAIEGGRRIGMALEGSISEFIPSAARPAFQGRSTLAGSIVVPHGDTPFSLETLFLETAAVKLDASGRIDPGGTRNRIEIAIATPADGTRMADLFGPGEPLIVSGLNLQASISGALASPQWTLTGEMAEFVAGADRISDLRFSGTANSTDGDKNTFTLNAAATMSIGNDKVWADTLRGPVEIAAGGVYGKSEPLTLNSVQLSTQAARVEITGSAHPFERTFDVSLNGTSIDLRTGIGPLDRLLAGSANVIGRVSRLTPADPLRFSTLRLETPAMVLAIDGSMDNGNVDLSANGELGDLTRLSDRAMGRARFTASFSGPLTGPTLSVNAEGDDITLSGHPFDAASLRFDGVLNPDNPAGEFSLSGRYQDAPVRAEFQLLTEPDGTRVLSNLTVAMAGLDLAGEISLGPDNRPRGGLTFDASDLSKLGDLLLVNLAGSLQGTVEFEASGAADRAVMKANGQNIRVRDIAIADVDADVTIADMGRPLQFTGQVRSSGVNVGGIGFDSLAVEAVRQDNGIAASFDARGNTISGSVSALIATLENGVSVVLDRADLTVRDIPIELRQAARLQFAGNEIVVGALTIDVGGGVISVDGSYGGNGDLRADIRNVPMAAIDAASGGMGLAGTISGTATLSGSAGAPRVAFDLTLSQATAQAIRQAGLSPLDLTARGRFENGTLTIQSDVVGAGNMRLDVSGRILISEAPSLDLSVGGSLPLSTFADGMARNGLRAEGLATPAITITGSLSNPTIAGTVEISGATFGDAEGRFTVTGGTASLVLQGDTVELARFNGTLGAGTVSASGRASLRNDGPIDGRAEIRNGRYVDGTLIVSTFDADLDVSGSRSAGITVGGAITLLKTTITLSSLPPTANQLENVRHRYPPVPVSRQWALLQQKKRSAAAAGPTLNLVLATSNPILVRGRGINADFAGRVQITGTPQDIRPTGRFDLLRGTLSIVGRQLNFDRGSLEFTGDINPDLDISVTSRTRNATVTLTISGTPDNPDITITSVPELPPDEALANLVFQQSSAELSPVQIARLADALLVLSGGARTGLFESLRRAIGIDRFDVSTDAEGNTTVGIGRYLNERTYIGAEQGIEDGKTKVVIDLNITDNLKLRAGAASDGETEAGIVFEREY